MTSDAWTVTNQRCDLHTLLHFSSVGTVSNGYLGLKGRLAELRGKPWPTTLIHGVFDELDTLGLVRPSSRPRPWLEPAFFEASPRRPAVANLPDPLAMRLFVADRELTLGHGEVLDFQQSLDLRDGVYRYGFDFRDAAGRTTRIRAARFASLEHAHRVYVRYEITPLDHDAPLALWSGIDGDVRSNLTRERTCEVTETRVEEGGVCRLRARTRVRGIEIEAAVAHTMAPAQAAAGRRGLACRDSVWWIQEFAGRRGRTIRLDRFVVLASSEDHRHGGDIEVPTEWEHARRLGFDAALDRQRAAWSRLWERADVEIEGDPEAQRELRFCLYHLLAAAPRYAERLSVPVKLLTGEHYQGSTFYDTDLYIVPFYIFTWPEAARTCLRFRWHGLAWGRRIAGEQGFRGAKLAWQAGPDGEECLGPWYRFVRTNIHINADVAWAMRQYLLASGDRHFLAEAGLELLVESARFYHSRAVYDPDRDTYDFADVAGPDESHCGVKGNFYTNALAARTLRWAVEAVRDSARKDAALVERLGLDVREVETWSRMADRLVLRFDPATGRYEQCEGFYELPPPPEDLLAGRREWFVPLWPYQAMNQPDVLMALVLLRDEFPEDVRRANWEYYGPKSMDFSSMSHAINAIAAADMGAMEEAYRAFRIGAGLDLDPELTGRHDTQEGLHGTALGGAWLAAVRGFGGVYLDGAGLRIDPRLPPTWRRLRFGLVLRGVPVRVTIEPSAVVLEADAPPPGDLPIRVAGRVVSLSRGGSVSVRYQA